MVIPACVLHVDCKYREIYIAIIQNVDRLIVGDEVEDLVVDVK